jgi:uncharacterized membrane protein
MSDQPVSTATPVAWPLRQLGRLFLSAVAGAAVALAAVALPRETRSIVGLDVFLITLVLLTATMVSVATVDQCIAIAKQKQPIRHADALASIAATLVGIAAIAVMLHAHEWEPHWLKAVHMGASLLALLLGWIAAQMTFAVQYMRNYYQNLETSGGVRADPGLAFPGQSTPDLWDFTYYSFTIAMCYQTSDVSITGAAMRRLTLMHAIYSFFFVATIIGFMVNILAGLA